MFKFQKSQLPTSFFRFFFYQSYCLGRQILWVLNYVGNENHAFRWILQLPLALDVDTPQIWSSSVVESNRIRRIQICPRRESILKRTQQTTVNIRQIYNNIVYNVYGLWQFGLWLTDTKNMCVRAFAYICISCGRVRNEQCVMTV